MASFETSSAFNAMSISRDNNVAAAPGRVRNAKKNVVFGRLGALRVFLFLEESSPSSSNKNKGRNERGTRARNQ